MDHPTYPSRRIFMKGLGGAMMTGALGQLLGSSSVKATEGSVPYSDVNPPGVAGFPEFPAKAKTGDLSFSGWWPISD